jgi:phosphonate transport system substrate-binding protein
VIKKFLLVFSLLALFGLVSCSTTAAPTTAAPTTVAPTSAGGTTAAPTTAIINRQSLSIYFVPSRDAAQILEFVGPLAAMLKAEMLLQGYNIANIVVQVGSTYEAVGEGMDAGTIDVGFLPGGTYAIYSADGNIDVALTATRAGLNKDSVNAKDWNDGLATLGDSNAQVAYYRSIVVAGPSVKGRALAAKVNNNEALTWADVSSAVWCVRSSSSSAGFIYPSILLRGLYSNTGLSALDSSKRIQTPGYGASMASLASGSCDVATIYADARRDYANAWTQTGEGGYGRTQSIWAETDVVFVTPGIYNDTISISKLSVDPALKAALQRAFINLIATEAGKAVFAVYSHEGYVVAQDSDYDVERQAQALLRG